MELDKIKEQIYENLDKVSYEERSEYGVIDAIADAFELAEKEIKNNAPLPVVNNSICKYEGCKNKTVDIDNLWCDKHDREINC